MNPFYALPLIILLLLRAHSRNSLTPLGLLIAGLTALTHSLHPSSLPFALLGIFFLAGTTATKVHHARKATLTLSSAGAGAGEGPRTHVQVLANSGVASLLVLLHVARRGVHFSTEAAVVDGRDVLLAGIVANYAAVAADTFSSELGILARSAPRLITTLAPVPRGTNGGVTLEGLLAGSLGASIMALTTLLLGPFHNNPTTTTFTLITLWGTFGSVLDSVLGAVLQASVIDRRTGKMVEGSGGAKVLTAGRRSSNTEAEKQARARAIYSGRDILDNNQVNALMAGIMSAGGMVGVSLLWRIPLGEILRG